MNICTYVTGFEKTRLSHTSNFLTLMQCNFVCECAIDLKILHKGVVAYRNNIFSHSKLCVTEFIKSDVCGSLVFSNPVTYMHICMMYVCMYVRTYVRMYVCMHACVYVCVYVCTYVCMYACMYIRAVR